MKSNRNGLLLSLLALLLTGCASKNAYVIARLDPRFSLGSTNKLGLAHQHQAGPDAQELARAIAAELGRQGFQVVPQETADYTLTYWIEDDWRTRKAIVKLPKSTVAESRALETHFMPAPPVYGGASVKHYDSAPATASVVDEQVPAQGIRLRLYSRENLLAGRLQPAWDGYIDGGAKISPKQQPILLKTLLAYFGKDFSGPAPLLPPKPD